MRQETRMSAYLEGTAKTTLGLRPCYREQVFPCRQQKKALLPLAGAGLSSSNEPMVISNIDHIKLHIRVYVCIIVDAVDTEPEQLEELILVQLIIGDIKQVFGRNPWP